VRHAHTARCKRALPPPRTSRHILWTALRKHASCAHSCSFCLCRWDVCLARALAGIFFLRRHGDLTETAKDRTHTLHCTTFPSHAYRHTHTHAALASPTFSAAHAWPTPAACVNYRYTPLQPTTRRTCRTHTSLLCPLVRRALAWCLVWLLPVPSTPTFPAFYPYRTHDACRMLRVV